MFLHFLYAAAVMLRCCSADIRGHHQPFGFHKEPTVKVTELETVPQPIEFYNKFVEPRKPVIFRGAATHSRAFTQWTVENLKAEYGDLVVRVEGREEDGPIPATELGVGRDTIRNFADTFRVKNAYVISQIPKPMERDVAIPPCLRCGHFAKSIQEVHLFVVAKGGKTLLHRDPFSNIHCVFNGTKDWIMIDDVHHDNVHQSESSRDEFGGYSEIDVDSVDLEEFPNIRKVEFAKLTLNGGDCLFIPGSYWHQVRVNGDYNTAVSIWFSRNHKIWKQNWDDCQKEDYDFIPMSEVNVLWRHSGENNSFPHGQMDIHVFRGVLLTFADEDGMISISHFCKEMIKPLLNDTVDRMKQALNQQDDKISSDKINDLSVDQIKDVLLVVNPIDVSNTPGYEYSYISGDTIRDLLFKMVSKNNHQVSADHFLSAYISDLGGTISVGQEIFAQIDTSGSGFINRSNLEKHIDSALKKFTDAPQHDPTTERLWNQHMRARDEL